MGPWIRIRIQGYKIKGKTEFNQHFFGGFFKEIIFLKSETKKVAYLKGLGTDFEIIFKDGTVCICGSVPGQIISLIFEIIVFYKFYKIRTQFILKH